MQEVIKAVLDGRKAQRELEAYYLMYVGLKEFWRDLQQRGRTKQEIYVSDMDSSVVYNLLNKVCCDPVLEFIHEEEDNKVVIKLKETT